MLGIDLKCRSTRPVSVPRGYFVSVGTCYCSVARFKITAHFNTQVASKDDVASIKKPLSHSTIDSTGGPFVAFGTKYKYEIQECFSATVPMYYGTLSGFRMVDDQISMPRRSITGILCSNGLDRSSAI